MTEIDNGSVIRDFAFQWDSDIKDLCTQNKQAKSGIPREKLSLVLEKMCVHECLSSIVFYVSRHAVSFPLTPFVATNTRPYSYYVLFRTTF